MNEATTSRSSCPRRPDRRARDNTWGTQRKCEGGSPLRVRPRSWGGRCWEGSKPGFPRPCKHCSSRVRIRWGQRRRRQATGSSGWPERGSRSKRRCTSSRAKTSSSSGCWRSRGSGGARTRRGPATSELGWWCSDAGSCSPGSCWT